MSRPLLRLCELVETHASAEAEEMVPKKILRRQGKSADAASKMQDPEGNGAGASMEEREQEYQRARERIFEGFVPPPEPERQAPAVAAAAAAMLKPEKPLTKWNVGAAEFVPGSVEDAYLPHSATLHYTVDSLGSVYGGGSGSSNSFNRPVRPQIDLDAVKPPAHILLVPSLSASLCDRDQLAKEMAHRARTELRFYSDQDKGLAIFGSVAAAQEALLAADMCCKVVAWTPEYFAEPF